MSELVWLFEWGIFCPHAAGPGLSPVGVTDSAPRARERMLDALGTVPDGVVACGWVAVLALGDDRLTYDVLATLMRVHRDSHGGLWLADVDRPGPDGRLIRMAG
jgi:hypothetical protein